MLIIIIFVWYTHIGNYKIVIYKTKTMGFDLTCMFLMRF